MYSRISVGEKLSEKGELPCEIFYSRSVLNLVQNGNLSRARWWPTWNKSELPC